jgi:hypothetical protein
MERQAQDVMDIDRALERAMDADDPGPAFAGRVVAAIKKEQAATGLATGPVSADAPGGRSSVMWRVLLPLAATVALTAGTVQWRSARADDALAAHTRVEDAQARAAHAQLVQALRLTGEQLNVVHRAIERSQE